MSVVSSEQQSEFVEYCMDFYGPGGIYDYDFNEAEIEVALSYRLISRADLPFDGDTIDREIVRDIVLDILREGEQ